MMNLRSTFEPWNNLVLSISKTKFDVCQGLSNLLHKFWREPICHSNLCTVPPKGMSPPAPSLTHQNETSVIPIHSIGAQKQHTKIANKFLSCKKVCLQLNRAHFSAITIEASSKKFCKNKS